MAMILIEKKAIRVARTKREGSRRLMIFIDKNTKEEKVDAQRKGNQRPMILANKNVTEIKWCLTSQRSIDDEMKFAKQ